MKYLVLALKKPAPICAMILDPRIKMGYFHKNYQFLNTKLDVQLSPESALSMFHKEAEKYKKEIVEVTCTQKPTKPSRIQRNIFGSGQWQSQTLETKINQYLTKNLQNKDSDILQYCSRRSAMYPSLLAMAQAFLSILAISVPTERVFSKSKVIVGPQQASLDPELIEQFMCVKEWYCFFGNLAAQDEAVEIV